MIVVDTGPLVAMANEQDRHHVRCEAYSRLPLGAADASVIAIAERLKLTDVATLDRRHFTVVRPSHVDAFTLLL